MRQLPLVTKEELQMVKDSLVLPILLDALEKDLERIRTEKLAFSGFYVKYLHRLQDTAIKELTSIRSCLRRSGIRIYDERYTQTGVEAHYVCRGYHYSLTLLRRLLKAEVAKKLAQYMKINLDEGDTGGFKA